MVLHTPTACDKTDVAAVRERCVPLLLRPLAHCPSHHDGRVHGSLIMHLLAVYIIAVANFRAYHQTALARTFNLHLPAWSRPHRCLSAKASSVRLAALGQQHAHESLRCQRHLMLVAYTPLLSRPLMVKSACCRRPCMAVDWHVSKHALRTPMRPSHHSAADSTDEEEWPRDAFSSDDHSDLARAHCKSHSNSPQGAVAGGASISF